MFDQLFQSVSDVMARMESDIVTGIVTNVVWVAIAAAGSAVFSLYTFLRRDYHKRVAKLVLRNNSFSNAMANHKKPHKYFDAYVEPRFVPIQFHSGGNKKELAFQEVWRVIAGKQGSKVMFVYAEAGMGKSEFCRYLVYRLMLNGKKRKEKDLSCEACGIYYSRFTAFQTVGEILEALNRLSHQPIEYIVLDGFDEFRALRSAAPDQLIEELFLGLNGRGDNALAKVTFSKLIITSRIELFAEGENTVKTNVIELMEADGLETDEPIDLIKIKHFDKERILKAYSNEKKRSADGVGTIRQVRRLNRFKEYLSSLGQAAEGTVFRNPFFIKYADEMLDSPNIARQKTALLTHEKAIHAIVDICFMKEYRIIRRLEQKSATPDAYRVFQGEFLIELDSIAKTMLEKEEFTVSNSEIPASYLNYKNTRVLLARSFDRLEFSHRIFLEYFVARVIQSVDFERKRAVLRGELRDIDHNSVAGLYAFFLSEDDGFLPYSHKQIQDSVARFADMTRSLPHGEPAEWLKAHTLVIKPRPALSCRSLMEALPVADEVIFGPYRLEGSNLSDYMLDHVLDVSRQWLTGLAGIEFFDVVSELDIQENPFTDISGLNAVTYLEKLWISDTAIPLLEEIDRLTVDLVYATVRNAAQLDTLLANKNIRTFHIICKAAAGDGISLYAQMRRQIRQGHRLLMVNRLSNQEIDAVVAEIKARHKASGREGSRGMYDAVISCLEDILYLAQKAILYPSDDFEIDTRVKLSSFYMDRGKGHRDKKAHEQAIADYSRAIDLSPANAAAYVGRGWVYSDMKQYREALFDCSIAVKLRPDQPKNYYARGRMYLEGKDCEAAMADYNMAISMISRTVSCLGCSKCYYCRGRVFHDHMKYEEAIADYGMAIEIDPLPDYFHMRGRAYNELGRYEEALADHDRAVALEPDCASYYNSRGLSYKYLKRYERALEEYEKAISLDPNDAVFYYVRGCAYQEMGRLEEALSDYIRANELDPVSQLYENDLIKLYQRMGQY